MFGRKFKFPIPKNLPATCPNCGAKLDWKPLTELDPVIGIEKVQWYQADCSCGEVHYRDGRGQEVEPPTENLAPDKSDVGRSPQGEFQYSGYLEFVQQERDKAAALEAKKVAAAAAPTRGGSDSRGGSAAARLPGPAPRRLRLPRRRPPLNRRPAPPGEQAPPA